MARIKVSPKYQIVIPKEIRESMNLRPGQVLEMIELEGIIELVPVKHPKKLEGTLKGMKASGLRDRDRL